MKTLEHAVIKSRFILLASDSQIKAEELLWKMAGEKYPPQVFAPILCGFARIVIGKLLADLNPWPPRALESGNSEAMLRGLAERLKTFLDENIVHPITLREIEAHFHYSGRHLNRIFQSIYHIPIGHYLRIHRMDLAKLWLSSSDRSIKEIALSLGYGNSSQFCRYFLKQEGLTPTQFRESSLSCQVQSVRDSISKKNNTRQ